MGVSAEARGDEANQAAAARRRERARRMRRMSGG
jgi:hypothetical protein